MSETNSKYTEKQFNKIDEQVYVTLRHIAPTRLRIERNRIGEAITFDIYDLKDGSLWGIFTLRRTFNEEVGYNLLLVNEIQENRKLILTPITIELEKLNDELFPPRSFLAIDLSGVPNVEELKLEELIFIGNVHDAVKYIQIFAGGTTGDWILNTEFYDEGTAVLILSTQDQIINRRPELDKHAIEGVGIFIVNRIVNDKTRISASTPTKDSKQFLDKLAEKMIRERFFFHTDGLEQTTIRPIPAELFKDLTDKFTNLFSLEGLKNFAVSLGIDFENLGGEGKKARELALHIWRNSLLEQLKVVGREQRNDIDWSFLDKYK